jgi:flavin-dependent dehydrogenase
VAVLGAGPSGSLLSTHLARSGLDVDVFERETFPRFHIGQSLLPMSVPLLEEIGVDLSTASYSVRKDGALFYSTAFDQMKRFDFSNTLDGTFNYAYQVQRGPFDDELAQTASDAGATVHFDTPVRGWNETDERVVLHGDWGKTSARYLVDATGQSAVLARENDAFRRIDDFGKIATYTMVEDVRNDEFQEMFSDGHVLVVTFEDAWGWCIPLPDDRASIGLVEKTPDQERSPQGVIEEYVRESSILEDLLAGGSYDGRFMRSANYSFYNTKPVTDRTVAVGDSYAFLDPIFASAIHRGLYSAKRLSSELLDHARHDKPLSLQEYFDEINVACEVFTWMIDKFYNTNWIQNMFFTADQPPRTQLEITSILAGDVWRNDNQYQNMLLESSRHSYFDDLIQEEHPA